MTPTERCCRERTYNNFIKTFRVIRLPVPAHFIEASDDYDVNNFFCRANVFYVTLIVSLLEKTFPKKLFSLMANLSIDVYACFLTGYIAIALLSY